MAEFVEVEQAIGMSGMRLVLSRPPAPWSESAKGILHVKKIPYTGVRQEVGGANLPLQRWTAQTSAPVFIYNDERPRSIWNDQLFLAERIAPDPPLIPDGFNDRILMFGLANELLGENGFGWARRLLLLDQTITNPESAAAKSFAQGLGAKYGYDGALMDWARARVVAILRRLDERLVYQHGLGSRFLVGERLSAVDIYWACFAGLLKPLPHDLCPVAEDRRRMYTNTDPAVAAALSGALLDHRDFIYHEYLELPIQVWK